MTKDFAKLLEKLNQENESHRVKIMARPASQPGQCWLSLKLNQAGGAKETRALKLALLDTAEAVKQNKENYALAREARTLMENQLLADENTGKVGSIKKKLVGECFIDYFNKIIKEKNQPNYRICRDHFVAFTGQDTYPIHQLTNEVCRGFVTYLCADNRSLRTAHNYLICFKAVLNSAVVDGLIKTNPAQNLKVKFPKTEKHRLTMDQLQTLYKTPCTNQQLKNAFFFSCFTGLRKADILNLTTDNIVDGYLITTTQKTKVQVKVKLKNTTLSIIEEQKKLIQETIRHCQQRDIDFDPKRLFSFQTGGRATAYLRQWFTQAGITAMTAGGNKEYSFHTARHTFISNIVEFGGNIVAAQKLVGHQDVKTTQIYTHLDDKIKIQAIDALPELE